MQPVDGVFFYLGPRKATWKMDSKLLTGWSGKCRHTGCTGHPGIKAPGYKKDHLDNMVMTKQIKGLLLKK